MSLGKVPGKMFEPQAQEPSMQGKHDNPAHERQPQGIVTPKKSAKWCLPNTYHREGGGGGGGGGREWGRQAQPERAKHTRAEVDLNSRAVKPRHHLQTSQPLCTPATGQATDQHCFAFNVT